MCLLYLILGFFFIRLLTYSFKVWRELITCFGSMNPDLQRTFLISVGITIALLIIATIISIIKRSPPYVLLFALINFILLFGLVFFANGFHEKYPHIVVFPYLILYIAMGIIECIRDKE